MPPPISRRSPAPSCFSPAVRTVGARSRSIRKLPTPFLTRNWRSSRMPGISPRWNSRPPSSRPPSTGSNADLETRNMANSIPDTPLFDRSGSIRGYKINKMAMALGQAVNREAFKADEEAYLDRFGLSVEEKTAVMGRDWHEMVRLGGNLFFILKISA